MSYFDTPPVSPARTRRSPLSSTGGSAVSTPSASPRVLSSSDPHFPTMQENVVERYSDRFIPSRRGSNLEAGFALMSPTGQRSSGSPGGGGGGAAAEGAEAIGDGRTDSSSPMLSMLLRAELLGEQRAASPRHQGGGAEDTGAWAVRQAAQTTRTSPNMFRFKAPITDLNEDPRAVYELSPVGGSTKRLIASPRKAKRKIPKVPFKVLDAPALQDDFYLNLVDWSATNVLAVGLGSCVYLWSACTSKVTKLCDLGDTNSVTSVAWTQRGAHLAVGTNLVGSARALNHVWRIGFVELTAWPPVLRVALLKGSVEVWDASKGRKVRTMLGHAQRVGAMSWNSHTLASGSRDRNIFLRDVRAKDSMVSKLAGHKQEVCGLKWSFDERQLASGGNDNRLLVWSAAGATTPLARFVEHTAAVKAIAWSPHQHGLLSSGGGTADRCIRFWNTLTSTPLSCVDTGSQVPGSASIQVNRNGTCIFYTLLANSVAAGVQLDVVQERERDRVHARLQPQPDHRLAVSRHDQGGHAYRPHLPRAVSRHVPGRHDHRHRRRRRDTAVLEHLSGPEE